MPRPEELPDYEHPPLTEVVLSVQFESNAGLITPFIGLLWETHYRDRFPVVEQHPPVVGIHESFDRPTEGRNLRISVTEGNVETPRVWFMTNDGIELIQVQQDRFSHNWRKLSENDNYPRYESIRDTFKDEYENLGRWLLEQGRQPLSASQCEVTYINHIEPSGVWESHSQAHRIFSALDRIDNVREDSHFEAIEFTERYLIGRNGETPLGRLHVKGIPVFKRDGGLPGYRLELTARGTPKSNDIESIIEFFDLGRSEIVFKFDEVTSEEMHKAWGKK